MAAVVKDITNIRVGAKIEIIPVTVLATASSGASSALNARKSGIVLGCVPVSNQDQHIDSVLISATTGVVTVTLAAAATANNYFEVAVLY